MFSEEAENPVEINNLSFSNAFVKPWHVNGTHFTQDLITISYSRFHSSLPKYVFISYQDISGESYRNITLPVVLPDERNPIEFAVCVKPLYGEMKQMDLEFLVEWFEIYKDLGISEFYIYNSSLQYSEQMRTILSYYRVSMIEFGDRRFFDDLVHTPLDEFNFAILISRASYVDCIYRNYKRVKYMLLVDTDEIVMPQVDSNYTHLLKKLFRISHTYSDAGSISAQMVMFFRLRYNNNGIPQTTKYKNGFDVTSKDLTNGINIRLKSFINTQTCIIVFHHHCIKAAKGYHNKIKIPFQLALTYHYRSKLEFTNPFNRKNMFKNNLMDKYTIYLKKKIQNISIIVNSNK